MATSADKTADSIKLFKKGKYVFTGALTIVQEEGASVPYFSAEAIAIIEKDGKFEGDVVNVKLSDLILKQSSYIDENGKVLEAHKLYVWPRNLGSTTQWTAGKEEFLNEFVMNFPIDVLSLEESNGVTWKYITPEEFKDIPEGINSSVSFKEYREHMDEYFFLRRPLKDVK